MSNEYQIALLPGDGIGPEIMSACVELLTQVQTRVSGVRLEMTEYSAGAEVYRDTGDGFPPATIEAAISADAILLAAMGLPEVRYPDGREISPQLDLRDRLQLYAGMRPIRSIPGVRGPLADPRGATLDLMLIRESTEGLFARRDRTDLADDGSSATNTMVITRVGAERVFVAAFEEAQRRRARGLPGRVTCVDKANVLGGFVYFRSIFLEVAERYPEIDADVCYIDAAALKLVREPWDFDVIVTENIFGDILSDLGAALIGGMGMAPSGDIGETAAVFQPCHGTAPDIVGTGAANPTAMFLSAAMMLEWLAVRNQDPLVGAAGTMIVDAVDRAFADGGLQPIEVGGRDGLVHITAGVIAALDPAMVTST